MGPQNAIIGQQEDPMAMPQTQQFDDSQYEELKKTARFSKSAEFKALQEYIQERVKFYDTWLPSGQNPATAEALSDAELGEHWRVATIVNSEFKRLLELYERANQIVKDESARRAAEKQANDGTA